MVDPSIFSVARGLLADPTAWGLILLGNLLGLIFGVIPGLNGGMAFIVLLPLTFGWEPGRAILFLMGLLGAQYFGGAIPAILINIPGTPMNAATCFEGYPMTRRGEAGRAIGMAAAASTLGGLMGMGLLMGLIPVMRELVLLVGSAELFWLAVVGLLTIGLAARGENFAKSLVAGGLGILLSLIGFSPVLGEPRYTLGTIYLWDGLQLAPLFIGLFAISQVMEYVHQRTAVTGVGVADLSLRAVFKGSMEVVRRPLTLLRASLMGTGIGAVPGVGGTVASFIAYTVEMHLSGRRDKLYTGQPEGLIASEAANNAKEGGSMIPTLGFGIPGSFEGALVLAAFILHGIEPGPFLVRYQAEVLWALVLSLTLSQILGSVLGLVLVRPLGRIMMLPMVYIVPAIVVFSFVGAYLGRGNIWDVVFVLVAGVFGYLFIKAGYSVVTLIIGFVLGTTVEKAFYQALGSGFGSYAVLFRFPAILLVAVAGLLVLYTVLQSTRDYLGARAQASGR